MKALLGLAAGLLFGAGIALSGMINPAKVLNFFDLAGHWDPSLMFVMGGALATTALGYPLIFRRGRPWLDRFFHLPAPGAIDRRLIAGSALFGVGWGIAGFCPGGSIPALALGDQRTLIFVAAMLLGIAATKNVLARI